MCNIKSSAHFRLNTNNLSVPAAQNKYVKSTPVHSTCSYSDTSLPPGHLDAMVSVASKTTVCIHVLLTRMGLLKTATTSSSTFLSSKHNTSSGGVAVGDRGRDVERGDNDCENNISNSTLCSTNEKSHCTGLVYKGRHPINFKICTNFLSLTLMPCSITEMYLLLPITVYVTCPYFLHTMV